MMKKVYFNHIPGNIHPVYQEMLDNPPEGIEYINKDDFGKEYQKTAINSKKNTSLFLRFFNKIISLIKKYYFLPNITFRKLPGDVIYSCQSLPFFGEYILDLDCYEALNRFSNKISENIINKYIVRFFINQKRCKKVIFWSESAKKSFQSYLGNSFDNKLEVVYPGIKVSHSLEELITLKDSSKIRIVSIGKDFIYKGIEEILEVAKNITSNNTNVEFVIIGQVPEYLIKKYSSSSVIFKGLINRGECIEYIKKSHIFLLPTFIDIFGFTFLEAFSLGAVCIGGEGFATDEIIINMYDGIVVKGYSNKIYNKITKKKNGNSLDSFLSFRNSNEKKIIIENIIYSINLLIKEKEITKKIIENGFEKVKNGKFSIFERNEKLKKILLFNN